MPNSAHTTWNTTDDGAPVAVRAGAAKREEKAVLSPGETFTTPRRSLFGPALLGIVLILIGVGWYLGFGDLLLGQLTESGAPMITITEEGFFDPEVLTVFPGSTIIVVNENPNPQVIKTLEGNDLLEPLVIFDEPVELTLPPEMTEGSIMLFSETLPEDRTITLVISQSIESLSDEPTELNELPIPIPFDVQNIASQSPRFSSSVSSFSATVNNGNVIVSLSGSKDPTDAPRFSSSSSRSVLIPVNPYTVDSTAAADTRARTEAVERASQELHGGAPLQQYQQYRPPVTTDTGPEHVAMIVLLLSGLLFWPVARRMS